MDRREMLGLLGAGAVGLTATAGRAAQAAQEHEHQHGEHEGHIHTIGHCAIVCNNTAHHCLEQICEGRGDAKEHAKVHEMAMDCQAFCVLTVTLMARHSSLAGHAHRACAEACAACAEACENSKEKSEQVQECARACRECEKVCREMTEHAGHGHHEHEHDDS